MNDISTIQTNNNADIYALLEERQLVAVLWGIEDVQSVRPDLNDDQAWEVLNQAIDQHDCELGFTWLLIEMVAEHFYPTP